MVSPSYAIGGFKAYVERAELSESLQDATILEIGPGDSIIAKCYGARAIFLDSGHYAQEDLKPYIALCESLRDLRLNPPDISSARSLEDVLSLCNAE